MLEVIKLIFYAFIALFVLVTIHEFGHFWVARKCGVKVLRFSIGFGKPLLRWQRGDTEFVLAGIPLGGYVKMHGEMHHADEDLEDKDQSFAHKPVWQRMAVVVAGPVANLILAVFLYFLIFFLGTNQGVAPVIGELRPDSAAERAGIIPSWEIKSVDGQVVSTWGGVFDQLIKRIGETGSVEFGMAPFGSQEIQQVIDVPIERWERNAEQPDLLGSLGIQRYQPDPEAVLHAVSPDSPAAVAGLQAGDRIIKTDGVFIESWSQWTNMIQNSPDTPLTLQVERDENIVDLDIVPEKREENGRVFGFAGVVVKAATYPEEHIRNREYAFGQAWIAAVDKTASMVTFILDSLKKLIFGEVSTKSLGGPVTIAKFAGASAELGWQAFFGFLAVMSVMLGVMNLLPIPVLDGGHLLFYTIELLKGSPINETIQGFAVRFGMTLVFGLMVLALYNDLLRL